MEKKMEKGLGRVGSRPLEVPLNCGRQYLVGQGDLVSRSVMGIAGVMVWLVRTVGMLS